MHIFIAFGDSWCRGNMVGAMSLKSINKFVRGSRSSGFTLIEVAMALMVVSIVMIPFLQIQRMQRVTDQNVDTYYLINNTFVPVLKSYALANKAFPAPADPKVDFTSTDPLVTANAGMPDLNGTNGALGMGCPGTTPNGLVCVLSNGNAVVIGTLPFKALGLPLEKGLDRYGHKYTYAVSRDHIDPTNGLGTTTGGWINIRNSNSTTNLVGGGTTAATELQNATYVIISHGEDGVGAYNANGVQNPCTAALTLEKINCDNDGTFLKLTEPYNSTSAAFFADTFNMNRLNAATYFDDSIVYGISPVASQWTERPQGATVGTFLSRESLGVGKAVIGTPKNGTLQAALEVGTTTAGGGNALASSVKTTRICDTQSAATSSSCMTTSSVANTADTTLKCGHYALSGLSKSGTGVTSTPTVSCDLSPTVPVTSATLANTIVLPCAKGAKSYNADGTITCY